MLREVSKAIPEIGRGGLWACGILRIQHCLGNRLKDGDETVSLKRRPRSTPQKCRMLQKKFYNDVSNITVWRVSRK
jgi:hypothetical protein